MVELPRLHQMLMHLVRVLSSALQPGSDGAFMEAKDSHNRLGWTAMGQQEQHNRDQIDRVMQTIERRSGAGGKGCSTGFAAIAVLFLAMDGNVALADLASCGTVQVVAKLHHRVHQGSPSDERCKSRHGGCQMNPVFSSARSSNHD